MIKRNISWEIIVAGLAFVGIAIFLLNRPNRPDSPPPPDPRHGVDSAGVPSPPIPPSIVIDLENLKDPENLKKLRNLEQLRSLEGLEFELRHLDKLISEHDHKLALSDSTRQSLDRSLQNLEEQFRKVENGNFNIQLQDNKVFINRRFEVEEASWSEVSPGVYVYKRSVDAAGLRQMELDLAFGNVNILGSDSSGGEIVLQATGDVANPGILRENLSMRVTRQNGTASFSVAPAGSQTLSDRLNLEATVTVPRQMNFDVNTTGGHISVTHLQGEQQFSTSGGHITLDDVAGTASAKTKGGHITGSEIDGTFDLSTAGGHIRIEQANGQLRLSTGGGHIQIEGLTGEASAKTSGGNISAEIATLNGPLDFSTSAGNISLLLPTAVNADINASGSSVSLDQAFNFSGNQTSGKLNGTINGGGLPVSIQCGYGNVSIKTYE